MDNHKVDSRLTGNVNLNIRFQLHLLQGQNLTTLSFNDLNLKCGRGEMKTLKKSQVLNCIFMYMTFYKGSSLDQSISHSHTYMLRRFISYGARQTCTHPSSQSRPSFSECEALNCFAALLQPVLSLTHYAPAILFHCFYFHLCSLFTQKKSPPFFLRTPTSLSCLFHFLKTLSLFLHFSPVLIYFIFLTLFT